MSQTITSAQLIGALQWRYATKSFDPTRQIPAATWAALEQSLVLTASSFGLQPYRILNITSPTVRAELMPHAWNQRQVVDASHFVLFASRTALTEAELDKFIARMVEVRGVPPQSLAGYKQMMAGSLLGEPAAARIPHWAAHQAYIALGNLLTSAALLGIDTCPMEGFVPAEFDRILDLPAQGYRAVVACALGYRSPTDPYANAPKVRFPQAELIRVI